MEEEKFDEEENVKGRACARNVAGRDRRCDLTRCGDLGFTVTHGEIHSARSMSEPPTF